MRIYCDCLDDDADCMTAESLKAAVRKFRYFPTVAELVEFFGEWRGDRRSSAPRGELGDAPPAIVNAVARKAMRDWRPPSGLGSWGKWHWEMWALDYAIDRVRDGAIRYTREVRDGAIVLTLLDALAAPVPTDARMDEWRRAKGYDG